MNQAKRKTLLVLSNLQQAQKATEVVVEVVKPEPAPLPVALKEIPVVQPTPVVAEPVVEVVEAPVVETVQPIVEEQPVVVAEESQDATQKTLRSKKFKKDVEVGQ